MITKKGLLIAEQIKSIDLEKKEIVIKLEYLPFMTDSIKKADKLLEGLLEQKTRWKCPKCGGTMKFYHYQCSDCGFKKQL